MMWILERESTSYFRLNYGKITGEFIASSVGVNPVIMRKITSQLRDAGRQQTVLLLHVLEGDRHHDDRGKVLYDRLMSRGFVAVTGLKGEDTMSSVSVNLRRKVKISGKKGWRKSLRKFL